MYRDFLTLADWLELLVLIVLVMDLHETVRLLRAMNLIFKTVSFTVFAL